MAVALLYLLAVLVFFIAAVIGFGVFAGAHLVGWIALGLLFCAAAWLISAVPR